MSSTKSSGTATAEKDKSAAGKIASSAIQSHFGGDEKKGGTSLKEIFFHAIALVAVGSSVAAIAVEGGLLVTVVGAVCAFLGPVAVIQQHKLTDLETMRQLQNQLRDEVNRLTSEKEKLKKENDRLDASAKRLEKVEGTLEELSKVQGQNVDILIKQVEEYKKVQAQMKKNLEAEVIQNLISVIIRSDDDEDFILDPEEVDGLIMRLKSIDGVDFSEANFKRAVEKAGIKYEEDIHKRGGFNLKVVMEVVKNLLDDKVPEKDNIFTIKTEKALSKNDASKKTKK